MTTDYTWLRGYLVWCACNPATGTECQFHARQPRVCPKGCGGQLNYQDGGRSEPVFVRGRRVGSRSVPGPTRTCNRCEHCE